jgi:hypothetical protein
MIVVGVGLNLSKNFWAVGRVHKTMLNKKAAQIKNYDFRVLSLR